MKCNEIFARSFTRHDKKRLGYGALVICIIVTWCSCTLFKSYHDPLTVGNLRSTMVDELNLVMVPEKARKPPRPYVEIEETKQICNTTRPRSDTCEMKGDVRIQSNSSVIFVFSSHNSTTIKPYARKGDERAMEHITSFTIKTIEKQSETMPKCTRTHNVPAIVFSVGGYSGNNYHGFTDVMIPLYTTSKEFNREVQFLIVDNHSRWTTKFKQLLENLSNYEIIDIDRDNQVHCFPSMIVGLKKEGRKDLHTDSNKDFTKFLRSSYSLPRSTALKQTNTSTKSSPRFLIISRKKTRAFVNLNDVVGTAREAGFEVIVSEMSSNMTLVSNLVNSCDVMLGVHGAGLTNMVFLPQNGVVLQVVPLGKMEWWAQTCYGQPSKAMGLKYLEYKISEVESTLVDEYPHDHQVFRDPYSIQKKGWGAFKSIYMDKQNIKLDIVKFKETLLKALELLHE